MTHAINTLRKIQSDDNVKVICEYRLWQDTPNAGWQVNAWAQGVKLSQKIAAARRGGWSWAIERCSDGVVIAQATTG